MKIFGEGMALAPKRIALHLRGGEAVGYDAPEGPHVALSYVALRDARAIVCVATASRRGMGCR